MVHCPFAHISASRLRVRSVPKDVWQWTSHWGLCHVGQDIEAEAQVWLVDHALGFTDLGEAILELKAQPALLHRQADE